MTISYEPDLSVKQIRERADVRYAIGDVGAAIAGHLKAMLAVSEHRRIIVPPVPAFYMKSSNLDEMVEHTAGRILDLFDSMSSPKAGTATALN